MTEQEKEELRRKIEARKQREAAGTGTVNNNQQTCTGCGSVIPANYDVCPVCGKVLRQGAKLKQQPQMQSGNSDRGKGGGNSQFGSGNCWLCIVAVWILSWIVAVCARFYLWNCWAGYSEESEKERMYLWNPDSRIHPVNHCCGVGRNWCNCFDSQYCSVYGCDFNT